VWAVGGGGTLLHWDGTAWTQVMSPTTNALNGVSGTSATDVWAVGAGTGFGPATVLHFNGTTWSSVSNATPTFIVLRDAFGFSANRWCGRG
jgi:hypothetical protein